MAVSPKEANRELMAADYRRQRWLLNLANKQNGKQGQTIHWLRCELEEVRSLISKNDRGDLRRYERLVPELIEESTKLADAADLLLQENERLRNEVKRLENPEPAAEASSEYVDQD